MSKTVKNKIILSSPLTHSDWVLKDNIIGLDSGLGGVRHMLDMCKAAGLSRIYWRMFSAGRSVYPSQLADPHGSPDEDNYFNPRTEDVGFAGSHRNEEILRKIKERFLYSEIDTFAEAVKYGHKIGLEIHAWFTINEEDHGWGWASRYSKEHSEYRWKRRNGQFYHSQLSFAYPQVREYKLALIKEVLEKYDIDGVFLDWIRTGDPRDIDQVDSAGVADYGYEDILVDGFKSKYGIDPHDIPNDDERWVKYRAEPITEFMRSVRSYMKCKKTKLPLAVMVQHPWGYRNNNLKYADNLRGLLLDIAKWANECLIDAAVPAGYIDIQSGGTPEKAYEHLKSLTEGKIDIWMYAWFPRTFDIKPDDKNKIDLGTDDFTFEINRAVKLGAKQILFWEADYIDDRTNKDELQKVMREHPLVK